MIISQTTIHDRAGRESIWLDDAMIDDDEDEDALEERDLDLTESGIISQLGLKNLPDDSY